MSAYWPFVVIGLFTGSIYGLGALGLVLTYKTTGVFNFAFGGVAMFCAYFYWQLHDQWHLTAWITLPLLLVALAPLIGLVFEALFRPLAGLSAEVPLVVSLAMLAVFTALANIFWKGQDEGMQPVIPRTSFRLGGHLYVGYDQLGTLLVALAMGGGLWWLLRHTRFGTATRAVVDNRDLASMIGVNGDRVRQSAWVISSMAAGLVGVLLGPSQTVDPNNLVLVVLASFTPALIGRLVSFPWAFGSALGLGVLDSILSKWSSSGAVANAEASIPWLVLFVALIVLGRSLKEAGSALRPMAAAATTSTGPPATIGQTDTTGRGARLLDRAGVTGIVLFAAALLVPVALHGPKLSDLTAGAIFTMIAATLVVLTGWAGQISIAQFSFVGVGAFAVGHLAGAHGQNFLWATLAAMAMSVPLGLVVGLPALRLKGLFLALATLAFALVMDNMVFNSVGVSGGITGITDPRPRLFGISFASTTAMYELAVVVLGVVLGGAYLLSRGPVGRRLRILRDSPLAASTLGVNLTVTKLVTFAVCGVVAAMGGALLGAWQGSITPLDYSWSWSLELLLLVVLGGRARLTGALIAGVVYTVSVVHLFAIPGWVEPYIQLGVALGVVGLGRNPEGTVAISVAETRRTTSVLRPRPARFLPFETLDGLPNGRPAGSRSEPAVPAFRVGVRSGA